MIEKTTAYRVGQQIFPTIEQAQRSEPPPLCCICEGIGIVRVGPHEQDPDWHQAWLEAETARPTRTHHHWVLCLSCKGTGKQNPITPCPNPT